MQEQRNSNEEVSMGTTIIALGYKDGVIVGADTRTSASGYVSNRFANKLTFVLDPSMDHYIHPYQEEEDDTNIDDDSSVLGSTCCICRSGSAADTQYLADAVRMDLISRQLLVGNHNGNTVTTVANLLKQRMNGDDDFQASLICAGYDHLKNCGVIYSIMPGGTCMEETSSWAISGSGSTYIHGFLSDALHTHKDDLGETDAIPLVTKALQLAMNQDGSSGGFIRIYVINRYGKREIILPHTTRTPKITNTANDDTNSKKNNAKLFAPAIRHDQKPQTQK